MTIREAGEVPGSGDAEDTGDAGADTGSTDCSCSADSRTRAGAKEHCAASDGDVTMNACVWRGGPGPEPTPQPGTQPTPQPGTQPAAGSGDLSGSYSDSAAAGTLPAFQLCLSLAALYTYTCTTVVP